MNESRERGGERDGEAGTKAPRWDASGAASAYCNVASARAAREGVALNFGMVQAARAGASLTPELLHRIVLAPRTARELHQILGRLLAEHDAQR